MTASSRPRLAALLIALLVGATALPPALHADMDDLACQFGAAQARAPHVDANDTHADSLHCEVCHWVRSMRAFEIAHVGTPTSIAGVEAVVFGPAGVASSSPAAPGTSRAPPLS